MAFFFYLILFHQSCHKFICFARLFICITTSKLLDLHLCTNAPQGNPRVVTISSCNPFKNLIHNVSLIIHLKLIFKCHSIQSLVKSKIIFHFSCVTTYRNNTFHEKKRDLDNHSFNLIMLYSLFAIFPFDWRIDKDTHLGSNKMIIWLGQSILLLNQQACQHQQGQSSRVY